MKTPINWALRALLLVAVVLASGKARTQQEDTQFVEWATKVITALQPPEKSLIPKGETAGEMHVRYALIAKDLSTVLDKATVYTGAKGKYQTAALMLAIARHESHFTKRVDAGVDRGDGGRSVCLMQINLGPTKVGVGDEEMRSWFAQDLIEDRKKCFLVAVELLRVGMAACKKYDGTGDVLSVYTSGKCQKDEKSARTRWNTAKKILEEHPIPSVT